MTSTPDRSSSDQSLIAGPDAPPVRGGRRFGIGPGARLFLLIVLGGAAGSCLATAGLWLTTPGKPAPWRPDTGQLTGTPEQKLTLLDPGRATVIPFLADSTQMSEVELTIDGRPARFVIDTGSSHVCVLSSAMEKLELKADAEFEGNHYTAQGRDYGRQGYMKRTVLFAIGNGTSLQVENVLVIPGDSDVAFQGLISGPFLQAIGATLDFRDRTLHIEGPPANPARKDDAPNPADRPQTP